MIGENENDLRLLRELLHYITHDDLPSVLDTFDRVRSSFTAEQNSEIDAMLRHWSNGAEAAGQRLPPNDANAMIYVATKSLSKLCYIAIDRLEKARDRENPENEPASNDELKTCLELAKSCLPGHLRSEVDRHPRQGVYLRQGTSIEHQCKVESFAGALGCSLGAAKQSAKLGEFKRRVLELLNRCSEASDALTRRADQWNIGNVFVARIVTQARDLLRLFQPRRQQGTAAQAEVEATDDIRSTILLEYVRVRFDDDISDISELGNCLLRFLAFTSSARTQVVRSTVIEMGAYLHSLAERFEKSGDSTATIDRVKVPQGQGLDDMLRGFVITAAPRFCRRNKEVSV